MLPITPRRHSCRHFTGRGVISAHVWMRRQESHLRPLGYEPSRLLLTYSAVKMTQSLALTGWPLSLAWVNLVPLVGIELTTYRLQGGCSTTELKRRGTWYWTRTSILHLVRMAPNLSVQPGHYTLAHFNLFKA
jgi:hypothetical protein